jgi:hypothetical protein
MHQTITGPTSQQQQKLPPSRGGRWLRAALPAAVLGALIGLAPSESHAAPRCTTKPAVCHRLAAMEQARAARPVVAAPRATAVAQNDKPRCTTKPTVCARLDAVDARRPSPPVTLAQASTSGPRCSSKPAVCARLRLRESAPPMTLASE